MRGHTSLMITEDSSGSDDESKEQGQDDDEENLEISSVVPESGSSSVEPDGSTSVRFCSELGKPSNQRS
jgi:hypothetical protein